MKRSPLKKISSKRAKEKRAFNSTFSAPTKISPTDKRSLRPKSVKLAGFEPWQALERNEVMVRAGAAWPAIFTRPGMEPTVGYGRPGRCEAQEFNGCQNPGEHVHHNYGRRQEPWSSWRHLCDLLCFECHESVTGRTGVQAGLDKTLRLQLQARAARRGLKIWAPQVFGTNRWNSDDEVVRYWKTFVSNALQHRMVPKEYEEMKLGGL